MNCEQATAIKVSIASIWFSVQFIGDAAVCLGMLSNIILVFASINIGIFSGFFYFVFPHFLCVLRYCVFLISIFFVMSISFSKWWVFYLRKCVWLNESIERWKNWRRRRCRILGIILLFLLAHVFAFVKVKLTKQWNCWNC